LVLWQAGVVEPFDGFDVERGDEIVVGQRHASVLDLARERGAFLEVEHVKRDVAGAGVPRELEGLAEGAGGLVRQSADEVQRRADAAGEGAADVGVRTLATMPASERAELGVVERLYTDAQAIHA